MWLLYVSVWRERHGRLASCLREALMASLKSGFFKARFPWSFSVNSSAELLTRQGVSTLVIPLFEIKHENCSGGNVMFSTLPPSKFCPMVLCLIKWNNKTINMFPRIICYFKYLKLNSISPSFPFSRLSRRAL